MATVRPGSTVTYCGVQYKVASVYRGEAELTTLSGVTVDWIPVHALHEVRDKPVEHRKRYGKKRSLLTSNFNDVER